ncbi:MAG: hypothetical protein M9962_15760, partial [Oligoflexia bacterium]|nr:hypothetical protein [Oligoflexia bacterium]
MKYLFLFLLSASSYAHPVSYKGSLALMSWNQAHMSDHWVAYNFRPDMSIAARVIRTEDNSIRRTYSGAQLNYLLKRWNGNDHQAN